MTSPSRPASADRTTTTTSMDISWDVPIPLSDKAVLRANVYRPVDTDRVPVIAT